MALFKKFLLGCGTLILLGTTFFIFRSYNPEESSYFPQCPSKYVTGYDCPGCGSQRAVHSLLNGQVGKAYDYNPLLFFLMPFGLLVGLFEWVPSLKGHPFRTILNNRYVILFVFFLIIAFTIWRNL